MDYLLEICEGVNDTYDIGFVVFCDVDIGTAYLLFLFIFFDRCLKLLDRIDFNFTKDK